MTMHPTSDHHQVERGQFYASGLSPPTFAMTYPNKLSFSMTYPNMTYPNKLSSTWVPTQGKNIRTLHDCDA